ncbi:MAG TPA: hypothetical protein VK174_11800 [Chitinophagales bacterium]|nr:hypothetical protein [Chitinophagales bacterium]
MRNTKPDMKKLAGSILMLGALAATKKILDKVNKPEERLDRNDKNLERKLAITSVVYHAIGIFYNE